MVLVGGEGTRLRPLTLTTPKQMLPVGGRPMIERVLGHLAGHGIDEAVLSLGYRPDAFIDAYPDGKCAGVKLIYAVEESPLDTAGAIRYAASQAGTAETFVVVNGDVLTGLDVAGLVRFHHEHPAEATIALTPVPNPSAFGVVPTDDDGRVLAFIEKPAPGQAPTNLINAGTYVLEPSVLDRIRRDRRGLDRTRDLSGSGRRRVPLRAGVGSGLAGRGNACHLSGRQPPLRGRRRRRQSGGPGDDQRRRRGCLGRCRRRR